MLASSLLSAIPGIRHAFFTREGGVSDGIYASLNGGLGSNDDPAQVAENRRRMARAARRCAFASPERAPDPFARTQSSRPGPGTARCGRRRMRIVTRNEGLAIGITTADCGPILFVDPKARVIGAAHAGWKGALTGVLESTIDAMEKLGADRSGMVAAIGPLIRQPSYEVGHEFVERFIEADADNALFFLPAERNGHAMFDLAGFIRMRLENAGVLDDRRYRHRYLCRRTLLQLPPLRASQGAGLRPARARDRAGGMNSVEFPELEADHRACGLISLPPCVLPGLDA